MIESQQLNNKKKHFIEVSNKIFFTYYDFNVNNVRNENMFKINWNTIIYLEIILKLSYY